MSRLIDSLSDLASPWLYDAVGAIAAAEAAVMVGLVFPGEVALVIGGVAASHGTVNLTAMIAVRSRGAPDVATRATAQAEQAAALGVAMSGPA